MPAGVPAEAGFGRGVPTVGWEPRPVTSFGEPLMCQKAVGEDVQGSRVGFVGQISYKETVARQRGNETAHVCLVEAAGGLLGVPDSLHQGVVFGVQESPGERAPG